MPNKYTPGPRRTVAVVVRLTPQEHRWALDEVARRKARGSPFATVVDVLREGIPRP